MIVKQTEVIVYKLVDKLTHEIIEYGTINSLKNYAKKLWFDDNFDKGDFDISDLNSKAYTIDFLEYRGFVVIPICKVSEDDFIKKIE